VIVVHVNGEPWMVGPGSTVADLVARLTEEPRGIAVAVNGTVVTRSRWAATAVEPGAKVEVLTAVQGG
jgi:sulfur carrier protein